MASPPAEAPTRGWPRLAIFGAFTLIAVLHAAVCLIAKARLAEDPEGAFLTMATLVAADLVLAGIAAMVLVARARRATLGRRRREEALASEWRRAHEVFENAIDPVLTFDAHGRLLAVNRAAAALLQRPADTLVGEPIHRFLSCGATAADGRFEPLALDRRSRSEALPADGELVPVEFSLSRTGDGDGGTYTAVLRDLRDQIEAERRSQEFAAGLEVTNRRLEEANLQLEEASRLKSEFLANTSHELRTPLNGMIGFLQLVLDDMCDSPEEEREFLIQALDCSRHLLGLINDVLDIAKIEAGKLTFELEPVDVRALFGDVYTLTHVQAAQKGLTLRFEPPKAGAPRVRADFGKAKQVLINLIGNSLKFTSRGSIVVRATERPDLGHTMFEVIDTGIGVPLERQRILFEKFTQGDGSSTRKYGGTGLGLAISRSLVELMGGVIGLESQGAGTGTRIYFSLPIWRADEEELESEDAAPPDRIEGPAGGALVLVVDDDPVFTRFLGALLQHHGYRTVTAASAEAAWVLVRRLRPAVVLLDYALTSAQGASLRTGWDLAERMATDSRTRHLPVVFVTGFDGLLKERMRSTTFARTPHHLLKPVEGSVLIEKIEEVVGRSRDGVVRLLLADDDPSVTAYVRKVLPEDRFHLEVANNGEECLHILRMQPRGFDLLLLDLMMPDVSGYDVLRELMRSNESQDLPVLILTNFPEARDEEERRLLERGLVLDVIAKSSVHENPILLPHIIDWHLQVARELHGGVAAEEAKEAA
jgi:PAS domain S-box-containing protein